MADLPKRPNTPTLDALFDAHRPPGGRPRFELLPPPGVGWVDQALTMFQNGVDWKNEPIDLSSVSAVDVQAATKWVMVTQPAAIRAGGWTTPVGDPNNVAFIMTDAELAAPQAAPPSAPPAPVPAPAPASAPVPVVSAPVPAAPVPASPAPSPESVIHQTHAVSWLTKLGHVFGDVAGYATPDNITKVAGILEALAPLLHKA